MRLSQFIDRIIEEASAAAWSAYRFDEPKRCGALAGLEACRGQKPAQLLVLLDAAKVAQAEAERVNHCRVEEARAFRHEVEWVCDCVSVVMFNQGQAPIIEPSVNAYHKVAELVGVAGLQ